MVLETENSKIKALTISLVRVSLPSSKKAIFSLSPYMAERGRDFWSRFIRVLDPIMSLNSMRLRTSPLTKGPYLLMWSQNSK